MDLAEINRQLSETLEDLRLGTWGTARGRMNRVKLALSKSGFMGAREAEDLLNQATKLMGSGGSGYYPTAREIMEKVSATIDELSKGGK